MKWDKLEVLWTTLAMGAVMALLYCAWVELPGSGCQ